MLNVKVALNENSYDIVIGHRIFKDLAARITHLNLGQDAVVVTNPVIWRCHGAILKESLASAGLSLRVIAVPSGERSKSEKVALRVIHDIATYGAGRKIFIIAFGGGVVGDLAGYVAAVYKRGIPYIQVPTTLLAQIDSAIGGKVAVDLPFGKNLIGAFYQPKIVWSDVSLLGTLSRRQIRNGLAEAVKYGVISDRGLFDFIDQNIDAIFSLEPRVVSRIVQDASKIKARVVAADERETRGVRTILNFGHTVGHAIETADQYRHYLHGEAVALGMRVACEISRQMKLLSPREVGRVNDVISKVGLPDKIKGVATKDILKFMAFDKKFKGRKNRFVLATGIGSVKVVEGVPPGVIHHALEAFR